MELGKLRRRLQCLLHDHDLVADDTIPTHWPVRTVLMALTGKYGLYWCRCRRCGKRVWVRSSKPVQFDGGGEMRVPVQYEKLGKE